MNADGYDIKKWWGWSSVLAAFILYFFISLTKFEKHAVISGCSAGVCLILFGQFWHLRSSMAYWFVACLMLLFHVIVSVLFYIPDLHVPTSIIALPISIVDLAIWTAAMLWVDKQEGIN